MIAKAPNKNKGQGLVEFALMLPVILLVAYGALELGRAFFAYIAITNASREGARIFTFWPDEITLSDINDAVVSEVGNTPLVDPGNLIFPLQIQCGSGFSINVIDNTSLASCPSENPIKVTVSYRHEMIFSLFFPDFVNLRRSTEMMVP